MLRTRFSLIEPMGFELTPRQKEAIQELSKESGCSPEELIDSLLEFGMPGLDECLRDNELSEETTLIHDSKDSSADPAKSKNPSQVPSRKALLQKLLLERAVARELGASQKL